MRLLKINGLKVDLDDKTAIGVTFQSYDVKSPGARKVNITNSFTIPATYNNLQIFGNANNPQSLSTKIYEKNILDYWVDNEQLISKAKVRVDFIEDRIGLFVFQKDDVWTATKKVLWPDFVADFIKWMQDEKGLPSKDNPFVGNFTDFLYPYSTATEGVKLSFFFSNLYNYDPDNGLAFVEDFNSIYLRYWPESGDKADGGHFSVYCKTIFEYIEQKYGVNFLTSGGVKNGNLWDDAIAQVLYIPIRDIGIRFSYTGGVITGYYFEYNEDSKFLPLKNQKDKAGKKLYDFINSFLQHLNVIIDEFDDSVIRLARFDDIATLADVANWSGRYTGIPKYKPSIDGYAQENVIKFKEKYEEADDLVGSKTLICNNENLDAITNLFDIDAYIPSFLQINGGIVPDLSPKEAFKTFVFLLDNGLTDDAINIYNLESGVLESTAFRLQKTAIYSLDGEYNLLDSIIKYPKFYEVKRWLTLNDIKDLEFFRLYWIKELNGSYFLNKISGFNPQKSKQATTLELIYVSHKTPVTPPSLNYWTDGVGDGFVDGSGDYFF